MAQLAFIALMTFPIFTFAVELPCTYAVFKGIPTGGASPRTSNIKWTIFNSRRMLSLNRLIKWQLDKKHSKEDKEKLKQAEVSISNPSTKAWDDPVEVSKKLRDALAIYLQIMEQKEMNGTLKDSKDRKNLEYARNEFSANVHNVRKWLPEFCKQQSTQVPTSQKGVQGVQ